MPNITHVVLYYGYVESSIYSPMIFAANNGYFETPRAALENLATSFFLKYLEDNELAEGWERSEKACCVASKKKKTKFCKDCGKSLRKESHIDYESYCDWLNSMCGHHVDGFGEDIPGWDLNTTVTEIMETAKSENVVQIIAQSEILMARILTPEMVPEKFQDTIREWQEQSKGDWRTVAKLMKGEM